jgi:hypothetical protein
MDANIFHQNQTTTMTKILNRLCKILTGHRCKKLPKIYIHPYYYQYPQNGCEKSIEYCQLKAATLAREGQKVFVVAVFALPADAT